VQVLQKIVYVLPSQALLEWRHDSFPLKNCLSYVSIVSRCAAGQSLVHKQVMKSRRLLQKFGICTLVAARTMTKTQELKKYSRLRHFFRSLRRYSENSTQNMLGMAENDLSLSLLPQVLEAILFS